MDPATRLKELVMRNLLRSLMLAVVLVPALAAVPPAQAVVYSPQLEACPDGGSCSGSGTYCVIRGNCPLGESCVCI